ncbi:hypothetical protein TNCV_1640571 [Trichonephila clavipes]|nr:hypothetical protein TNCV_1640571 [Trichonephila clavipes]
MVTLPAYFASNRNRDPKHNEGGIKKGEKRQESYKKSPGNVPGGGRVWIKRGCKRDKSDIKRVVGNEKGGTKRRGRFKGDDIQVKGEGFKGDRVYDEGNGFK